MYFFLGKRSHTHKHTRYLFSAHRPPRILTLPSRQTVRQRARRGTTSINTMRFHPTQLQPFSLSALTRKESTNNTRHTQQINIAPTAHTCPAAETSVERSLLVPDVLQPCPSGYPPYLKGKSARLTRRIEKTKSFPRSGSPLANKTT